MFGLLYHQPLQYNEYHYPAWAELLGWGLAMSSIIMIPLVAILQLVKTPGTFKEVRNKGLFTTVGSVEVIMGHRVKMGQLFLLDKI